MFRCRQEIKGRKPNVVVDTTSVVIGFAVTAASVQNRDAAADVVAHACAKPPGLQKLYTDGAYGGKYARDIEQQHHIRVEVVRHLDSRTIGTLLDTKLAGVRTNEPKPGFAVLPKRWAIERTDAWTKR